MLLRSTYATTPVLLTLLALGACGKGHDGYESLVQTIGPEGGTIEGEAGSPFEGVRIVVPPGALDEPTDIAVERVDEGGQDLPDTALACGPMFDLQPSGLVLHEPAEVTLPFDAEVVHDELRLPEEVKVWVEGDGGWGRELPIDTTGSSVSVLLDSFAVVAAGVNPAEDVASFSFTPNARFTDCMARYPGDPSRPPRVDALVVSGDGAETMWLYGNDLKPGIAFDLFTVERSSLDATAQPVADFPGFGFSWYQADLEADRRGRVYQVIRTILLNEPFGLVDDATDGFPPTRTFHAGFWFNDPEDAAACGFDPSQPTPFNGEQQAGPLAMITLPDAVTGLGPLCTDPESCTE
ncbi:MAG: hypothetical protein R3F59_08425 [Myxococcota bacterium]